MEVPGVLEYGSITIPILGGSWVVRSGVIIRVTIVITHIKGLIALLITTHEPPSRLHSSSFLGLPYRILKIKPPKTSCYGAHR